MSLHCTASEPGLTDSPFKGGTIRKLLEGERGGADEVPKKYSRKGKKMKKIHARQLHSFFYKNIFYKNIEADICEILRIF